MRLFSLFLIFCFLQANDVIEIESKRDIVISEKTGVVTAKIVTNETLEDEKQAELEKLKSFELMGVYKNNQKLDGSVDVLVEWNKLKSEEIEIAIPKEKVFESSLVTKTNIPESSRFRAKGDLNYLDVALTELNNKVEQLQSSNTQTSEEQNNNTSKDNEKLKNDDVLAVTANKRTSSYPNTGGGFLGGGDAADIQTPDIVDNVEEFDECSNIIDGNTIQFREIVGERCIKRGSPVPILETAEGCTPRVNHASQTVEVSTKKIAELDGNTVTVENCSIKENATVPLESTFAGCNTVFRKDKVAEVQQEQLYYTYNQVQYKIGTCVDSKTIFPVSTFTEWNKGCKPLIDYGEQTIKFASREMANVNGSEIEITPCKYEKNTVPLVQTFDGCNIRDDFTKKESIQQERYYYMFENKKHYVGECMDSNVVFPHYQTSDTCPWQKLNDDFIVYNKRTAYRDVNNIVKYLTECQPSNEGSIELTAEFCGYEHDFMNNQSYPREKKWFNDPDTGEQILVTSCTKMPLNFPHKEENCGWSMSDENLYGIESSKIYFTDNAILNKDFYLKQGDFSEEQLDDANGCIDKQPTPYVKVLERVEFVQSLGYKQLEQREGKWYIANTDNELDHGNGLYPTLKGGSIDITKYATGSCKYVNPPKTWTYGTGIQSTCVGGILSTSSISYQTYYEPCRGGDCTASCLAFYKPSYYTKYTCNYYDYWEEIAEYNLITEYLRPDGSTFPQETKKVYRIHK